VPLRSEPARTTASHQASAVLARGSCPGHSCNTRSLAHPAPDPAAVRGSLGALAGAVDGDCVTRERPPRVWKAHETAAEVALVPHRGPKSVGAGTQRVQAQTCLRTSWRRENDMPQRARPRPKSSSKERKLTQRDCLRCERPFHSEGPFNRLCKPCLEYLNASPTPMEEYTIGSL
jgi:hypothetical protein